MNEYLIQMQRALLLLEQNRIDLAKETLQSAIASEPEEAMAYRLLANVALIEEDIPKAEQLVQRALGLQPDDDYCHFILSRIHHERGDLKKADASIRTALEMDPTEAQYYAQQAAITFDQYQWTETVEACERGLEFDPDHKGCINLRAIALTKLGKREDAGAGIRASLAKDPEDATSHANMGWTLLHDGKPYDAATHFREALRLEPNNDWARSGIVEALKARNVIYRSFLHYTLWLSSFSPRTQLMLFVGIIVVLQVIARVPSDGIIGVISLVLIMAYLAFALSVWIADPLFNLLLRFDKDGKHVLTEEQRRDTNWLALGILVVGIFMAGPIITGYRLPNLVAYSMLLIALSVAIKTPYEGKRMLASLAALAIFAIAAYQWYECYFNTGIAIDIHDPAARKALFGVPLKDLEPGLFESVVRFQKSQSSLTTYFTWGSAGMTWLAGYFHSK